MNIMITEFGSMPAGDTPVLNLKLIKRLIEDGHEVSYIMHSKGGYHLHSNKELLDRYLNFFGISDQINHIDLDENRPLKYNEFLKYTNDEIYSMMEFDFKVNEIRGRRVSQKAILGRVVKYLENLRHYHEQRKIDMFIVWGSGLVSRTIHYFSRKNNIPIRIFELGYFRPFTVTIDYLGVNQENSVPRDRDFYESIEIDYDRYSKYLLEPEKAIPDVETDEKLRSIYYEFIEQSNGTPVHENKIKIYSRKTCEVLERFKKNGVKYLFVPFQLETDTQMIRFSKNIKTCYELVKYVIKAVEIYNTLYGDEIKVIFKNHPMWKKNHKNLDVKKINDLINHYDHSYYINHVDTIELIKHSTAVITINSTVGLEALMHYKPVITLGEAFYNIPGISNHCEDPNRLYEVLHKTLYSKVEVDLIKKFLYYLRFYYFVEAYYPATSDESVERIYNRIMSNN